MPRQLRGVAAVVNALRKSARWFPARSCTSLVATTVTTLAAGSVVLRVTVRLSAERLTAAPNRSPPAKRAKVVPVIVLAFKDSEKVSITAALGPTSRAPSLGVTITTSGGVISVAAVVTNVLWKECVPLPARSPTWPSLTVSRTCTLPGKDEARVKVTSAPLTA